MRVNTNSPPRPRHPRPEVPKLGSGGEPQGVRNIKKENVFQLSRGRFVYFRFWWWHNKYCIFLFLWCLFQNLQRFEFIAMEKLLTKEMGLFYKYLLYIRIGKYYMQSTVTECKLMMTFGYLGFRLGVIVRGGSRQGSSRPGILGCESSRLESLLWLKFGTSALGDFPSALHASVDMIQEKD